MGVFLCMGVWNRFKVTIGARCLKGIVVKQIYLIAYHQDMIKLAFIKLRV
jgi:hypothetical protein